MNGYCRFLGDAGGFGLDGLVIVGGGGTVGVLYLLSVGGGGKAGGVAVIIGLDGDGCGLINNN